MFDERTNLYQTVAQTLQWIQGLTSIEYNVLDSRLAEVSHDTKTHYSFEVTTNQIRLAGIRHPLGLVVEHTCVVLTGTLDDCPEYIQFDKKIAPLELEDMTRMFLHADNGGYSIVGAQTRMGLFTGGEDILSRHFVYRNNLLHQIR